MQGWVDLAGLDTYRPKTVTHHSANRLQRRVTSFMLRTMLLGLPLRQTGQLAGMRWRTEHNDDELQAPWLQCPRATIAVHQLVSALHLFQPPHPAVPAAATVRPVDLLKQWFNNKSMTTMPVRPSVPHAPAVPIVWQSGGPTPFFEHICYCAACVIAGNNDLLSVIIITSAKERSRRIISSGRISSELRSLWNGIVGRDCNQSERNVRPTSLWMVADTANWVASQTRWNGGQRLG